MSKKISKVAFAVAIATASTTFAAGNAQAAQDPDGVRPAVSGTSPSQFGTVERVAGRDRVQTSIEVSKALSKTHPIDTVIIAGGHLFPDALSTVPLADVLDAPVLLNNEATYNQNVLHALVKAEVERLKAANGGQLKVVILGGDRAVGPNVARALEPIVGYHNIDRVAGDDRFETAYNIAADTTAAYGNARAGALNTAKQELRELVLAERN